VKTLASGVHAPDFELADQTATVHRLSELLPRGPVALAFYPAAGWGAASREAAHFRDLVKRYAAAGAHRIGVSAEDVAITRFFAEQEELDFPVLSDAEGDVAAAYGVRRPFPSPVKRTTFVIDQSQRILEVIWSETNMRRHAERALEVLERIA
jgi:thioredoxin-dependent peroxiredoxin